jgi:glycosyltransferase involved in cell wall biosynthesis/GT2 family glycosyltransferase
MTNSKRSKIGVKIINPYLYLLFKSKGNKKKFQNNKKIYDSLKTSQLFDEEYYTKKYPNIQKIGINPLLHYILIGNKEGKIPSNTFEKIYNYLKTSQLFDEEYYTKKYPNIQKIGINPLLHYIIFGKEEEKFPSIKFDGNYYLDTYNDVKKSNFNPLVHYILYGQNEGRVFKSRAEDYKFTNYSTKEVNNILSAFESEMISVILYIYNNYEESEKCIKSILENTKINYELILIIDFNTDRRINSFFKRLDSLKNLKIINNSKKLGFLKSVNLEIKNSKGDILLINNNNISLTRRWLQKMEIAAYSDEKIGTVSPLFNFTQFLLYNIAKTSNNQPLKPNEIANLIENASEHLKPEISTPLGPCIYIKRDTINDAGLFKEENKDIRKAEKKYYQKLLENGWKNIVDDSTYVHQNIDSHNKYQNIKLDLSSTLRNRIIDNIKIRSKDIDLRIPKKKILYVLHENVHGITGGTGQTTRDIFETLDETFECYILTYSGKKMILWKREKNQTIIIKSWKIKSKWSATEFYNDEFKNIYFQVLIDLNIDILHIQHLIRNTYDLPKVANTLGIPIILSFHDFYYICPTINLLDHNNHYCAGQCNAEKKQCSYPVQIFGDLPILTDFIDIWRENVSQLIDICTTFTAPTHSTMDLYVSIYPKLRNKNHKIIEHGRNFEKLSAKIELPSKNKPIKILVPGIIKNNKGHDFIKKLKENDIQNHLELHFMGIIDDDLKEKGIYHGKYKREDFCKIVNKIKPSFIGIFSICPETYCHTLSEAWSCGIPVLATKLGALKERIEKNGGGWFLDYESPLKAYNEIIRISNSSEEYLKVAGKVSNIKLISNKEMVDNYEKLYDELIENKID